MPGAEFPLLTDLFSKGSRKQKSESQCLPGRDAGGNHRTITHGQGDVHPARPWGDPNLKRQPIRRGEREIESPQRQDLDSHLAMPSGVKSFNLYGDLMPEPAHPSSFELRDVLLETYAVNDSMNQLLLAYLDPRAWRARLPGKKQDGRSIAAIYVHLHNSRLVWLRNSAPHLKCPAPLDPDRCTMKQASAAHKKSATQCLRMLTDALSDDPNRRVTKFSRGSWAPVWPAGASMFAYMFSHEAHHRGQIIMLAHQLGYRLSDKAWGGIWQWNKLWKEIGLTTRPR